MAEYTIEELQSLSQRQKMELVLKVMERARGDVSSRLAKAIDEVVSLCMPYKYLGKRFVFSYDETLNEEVNAVLIALSDSLINDFESMAKEGIAISGNKEDEDALILPYIRREVYGEDLTKRVDKYSTHLKHMVEAYIAIGFANMDSKTDILYEITLHLINPFTSQTFRDAVKAGGYYSRAIKQGGFSYGKGTQKDIENALILIAQQATNEAYQFGTLLSFRKDDKVIGYKVFRGSSYDCPVCDELCKGIHPLTEVVLPAHPRCCCFMEPVYL